MHFVASLSQDFTSTMSVSQIELSRFLCSSVLLPNAPTVAVRPPGLSRHASGPPVFESSVGIKHKRVELAFLSMNNIGGFLGRFICSMKRSGEIKKLPSESYEAIRVSQMNRKEVQ